MTIINLAELLAEFEEDSYSVIEGDRKLEICVILIGRIDDSISVAVELSNNGTTSEK